MRITKNAFTNLAISMIGFGVITGFVFPFAISAVGVSPSVALTPWFFGFTVSAGILVGSFNIILTRVLVRPRLRLMARRMAEVEEGLKIATYTGDWTKCDPDECSLPVDSDDEFGEASMAFNRLLEALAESHGVETRISQFTDAMSAVLDVTAICDAAIDSFRRDLGAAGVAIIVGSGDSLEILASHGLAVPESLLESDVVLNAIRSLSVDSMNVPEQLVIDAAVATMRPRHVLIYPLVLESTAIGAVVLAASEDLPPSAQALGPLFIRTLTVALSNAMSHQSIRQLAARDSLTGVLNRRSGLELLRVEFERMNRSGQPMSVMMADIDHFKQVNDHHGHPTGDTVLRAVTEAITSVLRADDFVVRYGGEEFLIGLPGAPAHAVAAVAERIRMAAESCVIESDREVPVSVTLSIGSASTSDMRAATEMDLVAAADVALLQAKSSGRNRVIAA